MIVNRLKSNELFGIKFNDLSQNELRDTIIKVIKHDECIIIFTPNILFVPLLRKDELFHTALTQSDMNLPDGMFIMHAARFLSKPFSNSMLAGRVIVSLMFDWGVSLGWSFFFFGSTGDNAERAKENVQRQHVGIRVVGAGSPSMNISNNEEESLYWVSQINDSKANVLVVGLGIPIGEKWIIKYRQLLNVNVIIQVGKTIDVLSGRKKIPPRWMATYGLEWVFEILEEPARYKRYLMGFFQIIPILLYEKIKQVTVGGK